VARSTALGADATHADDGFSLGALGAWLSLAPYFHFYRGFPYKSLVAVGRTE
jgi:hypothetical protein